MTKTLKDVELSERLRELIQLRFGDRGRFRSLEEASGIPEWKWKNFFYRRQEAGKDQVSFWVETYPEDEPWLVRGIHTPGREEFPFNAEPPVARQDQTIGDRLNWVIEEFAAPRGEQLFTYLAGRYGRGITTEDWRTVILRKAQPTLEMVALVCSDRPMFTEWVLLGRASPVAVDPTDKASVERWKSHRLAEREKLARLADQKL
jgi:hypothetical protein